MCSTKARATTADIDAAAPPQASAAASSVSPPIHLILIDGSGFIFRAFHALPPMTRPDGTPVNAVFGFTNMLAKLLKDHVGTHLAVIFDAGRLTFRNRLYDLYKAQRPDPPAELIPQFALVRDATAAFGVPAIELADWEADDLIASYARDISARGGRTTIVSSDKDLMQLIRPGVDMLDPIKQKPIGAAEVMEKFGVTPDKLIDVQALMGDSVDNVPGVPGIGPKNASQLINEYGDLERVLAQAPAMKPSKRRDMLIAHAEAARLSRVLVTLREDAPLPLPVEQLGAREPDRAKLARWLLDQGFRSTMLRLGLDEASAPKAATLPKPGQGSLALDGPLTAPASPASPAAAPAPLSSSGFGPYECVTTIAALQEWVAVATRAGVVAVDVETDGLDPMRANLVGFSLATEAGRSCYVPRFSKCSSTPNSTSWCSPAPVRPTPRRSTM
jgi:DNA polymerase-1